MFNKKELIQAFGYPCTTKKKVMQVLGYKDYTQVRSLFHGLPKRGALYWSEDIATRLIEEVTY